MRFSSLCVFCGSHVGHHPEYAAQAVAFGHELARRRIRLVYGGGGVGLMNVLADAAIDAGAEVVGVIPEALLHKELGHSGLTELHVVHSMHERKALMADLSGGFVALPGGIGTLEEFCEILTWAQLGLHEKPCGLLNVRGYFNGLLQLLHHAAAEGFFRRDNLRLFTVAEQPVTLLDQLEHFHVPHMRPWLTPDET